MPGIQRPLSGIVSTAPGAGAGNEHLGNAGRREPRIRLESRVELGEFRPKPGLTL